MKKAMKKQLRLQRRDWLIGVPMILGGMLFGIAVMVFLVKMEGISEIKGYIPVGTLLGMIMCGVFCGLVMIGALPVNFNLQVSLGCTRKQFFVSYYLTWMLGVLVYYALLLALWRAECLLYERLWPALECGADFGGPMLRWGIPVCVVFPIVGGFLGAMIMRFGRKAGIVLWVVWMVVCLGGPKVADAMEEAPDSVYGRIGTGILELCNTVPGGVWAAGILAVALLCLAGAYGIVRRQQVTL